jgi:hypothetical protein
VQFFIGSWRIPLLSGWTNTIMYWLPLLDFLGNCLVWSEKVVAFPSSSAENTLMNTSQSVLHQQRCQLVSRKVHGGQKRGEANKWDPRSPTCYLLLNSLNVGRGTEGTHTFRFSPLNFVSKKLPGTSHFCYKASANQSIQVKKHHGCHELERSKYCPNDGRDSPRNAAMGLRMSRGKRLASLSPTKQRISSNFDGR